MTIEHNGEALRLLLERERYTQAQLAKAAGVTRTAVGRWSKAREWSKKMREKIHGALRTLGLDPGDLSMLDTGALDEPEPCFFTAEPTPRREDLTPLVESWPVEILTSANLQRILEADDSSREELLRYVRFFARVYARIES